MQRRSRISIFAVLLAVLVAASPEALAQREKKPSSRKAPASTLAEPVGGRVDAILASLESPKADVSAARRDAGELFDWVCAYGDPDRDGAAFRSAALGDRQLAQLEKAPKDKVGSLAALLRKCPTFAARIAFLTVAENKEFTTDRVYAMVDRLAASLGSNAEKVLEEYAECAAAVCCVRDVATPRRVNENSVTPPDGVEIFNYFVKHEKSLAFGLKDVPAGLLIFVVDAAAPIDELEWALAQFGKSQNVQQLYDQVAYDFEHIISGKKKKITAEGFTLQNIKKWGGVCVDQAYFTTEVAKAQGIPATVVTGRDVTIGHAWVGIFKAPKSDPGWDFSTGRYESYQKVRGSVVFPVTGVSISDGVLDVLADSFAQPAREREEAYSLASAGERLAEISFSKGAHPYPPRVDLLEGVSEGATARPATIKSALALLRESVERSPSTLDGWWVLRRLAKSDALTMDDRREWAGALERLCGKKYPDFTWIMLEPMISSIDDPKVQEPMWERAMQLFRSRPDLSSSVRFAQAAQWRARDNPAKAWDAYQDVIDKFANDSPMVIPALAASRALLESKNKKDEIIPMYERVWKKLKGPEFTVTSEFRRQSNWYQVGTAYAALLAESGKKPEAMAILSQLGAR